MDRPKGRPTKQCDGGAQTAGIQMCLPDDQKQTEVSSVEYPYPETSPTERLFACPWLLALLTSMTNWWRVRVSVYACGVIYQIAQRRDVG